MEDKNKDEQEKDPKTFEELGFKRIFRKDDSDDEFNPSENSLNTDKDEFFQLLAEIWNRKMGGRYDSTFEEMKEAADQKLNKYIQQKVNALKVRGKEASEDDRQAYMLAYLNEMIESTIKQIDNTDSVVRQRELEHLLKYLEDLKNPAKPADEKQSENAVTWALYYYYRHKAKPFPDFLPDYEFRKKKLFEKANEHGVSPSSFYITFDAINANTKERNPLRGGKRSSYLKQVIGMLSDFPEAKELAEKDLTNNNQ